MSIEDAKKKLNELGKKWGERDESDLGLCKNLRDEIFDTINEIYRHELDHKHVKNKKIHYLDGLSTFYSTYWEKFNPEKGLLYNYVDSRLKYCLKIDEYRDSGAHIRNHEVEYLDHLNEPLGEDQNEEKIDQVSYDDDQYNDFAMRDDIERKLLQMSTLMINIRDHLNGKSNNETSILYKKMFHTETTSMLCQEGVVDDEYPHERELIESLKYTFLDYYTLDEACRSIEAIRRSPLKRLCDISEEDPDNDSEAKLPLKQSVFITYLKRFEGCEKVSDSNITDQRKKYYKFLKEHIKREE